MEAPPQIVVRNVDPVLWRRVRSEAVKHSKTAGALLNEVIREWLRDHECEDCQDSLTTPPVRP
jgi:hypothetical protein